MRRPSGVIFFSLLCGIFSSSSLHGDTCPSISQKLRQEIDHYDELMRLRDDLNAKFEGFVKEDFVAQSEGVLDEIHHNAALKVAFARKRLQRSIDAEKLKLNEVTDEYCSQCGPQMVNAGDKKDFCAKCPKQTACK